MAPDNDYFTPERVDEQIEHLQRTSVINESSNEAQLVDTLHRYYRAPAVAEHHTALERVRQRVLGNHSTGATLGVRNEWVTSPSSSDLVARSRSTRLMGFLSGLAAVILVGTLVGGWLAVTHLAGTSPTVSPSTPSSLYVVQHGVAYRLAASSGKVIWQDRLVTSRQSGSANIQVVNGVVYVVLDFDLYALDAGNGKQIWHDSTTQPYAWFEVANGRMYLYNSPDGTFSARSAADGSLVWNNTAFSTGDAAYSTVLDGNLYTVNNAGTTLYCLDGATGQYRWNHYLAANPIVSAPLVANGVVYAAADNSLDALNEQTGETIWKQTVPVAGSFATAYLAGGVLYITNLSPAPVPSSQQKFDDKYFFAYNAKTGRLLWAAEPGYATLFNLPITSGLLFAPRRYSGTYTIAGLDPRTGHVAWQMPFQCAVTQLPPELGQVVAASCNTEWAAIINGKLYLLERDISPTQNKTSYTLKSFNPGTGQLLSASPVTLGQNSASPVTLGLNSVGVVGAGNGLLYIQIGVPKTANDFHYDEYSFAAYRLSDGSLAWSHSKPLSPAPTSANTQFDYSQVVLAPSYYSQVVLTP
ncbi:MAG: PQQ-binding-like beta-propeller repeat protein [Ktedonobacterales bacterium]